MYREQIELPDVYIEKQNVCERFSIYLCLNVVYPCVNAKLGKIIVELKSSVQDVVSGPVQGTCNCSVDYERVHRAGLEMESVKEGIPSNDAQASIEHSHGFELYTDACQFVYGRISCAFNVTTLPLPCKCVCG